MLKPSELTPATSALAARARRRAVCRGRVRGGAGRTRRRPGVRRAAVRSSVLHRLDRGGPRGGARGRGEPHAGHARARRQVARAARAGCGFRARGAAHHVGQAPQCRTDVHRARLRARAEGARGRLRGRGRRPRRRRCIPRSRATTTTRRSSTSGTLRASPRSSTTRERTAHASSRSIPRETRRRARAGSRKMLPALIVRRDRRDGGHAGGDLRSAAAGRDVSPRSTTRSRGSPRDRIRSRSTTSAARVRNCERVLARRRMAGGVTVNDTLWHFAHQALPFGGVGASGHRRVSRRGVVPRVHASQAGVRAAAAVGGEAALSAVRRRASRRCSPCCAGSPDDRGRGGILDTRAVPVEVGCRSSRHRLSGAHMSAWRHLQFATSHRSRFAVTSRAGRRRRRR